MKPDELFEGLDEKRVDWNEAAWCVRSYLSSLKLLDEMDLLRWQQNILLLAREEHAKNPQFSPLRHAFRQLRNFMASEIQKELRLQAPPDKELLSEALLACHLRRSLPPHEQHTDDNRADSAADLLDFPSLDINSMTPRPMDYGALPELERMGRTRWLPLLNVFLIWLAIYLMGYVFLYFYHHE